MRCFCRSFENTPSIDRRRSKEARERSRDGYVLNAIKRYTAGTRLCRPETFRVPKTGRLPEKKLSRRRQTNRSGPGTFSGRLIIIAWTPCGRSPGRRGLSIPRRVNDSLCSVPSSSYDHKPPSLLQPRVRADCTGRPETGAGFMEPGLFCLRFFSCSFFSRVIQHDHGPTKVNVFFSLSVQHRQWRYH